MKSASQFEKWASAGLGIVCLLLIANLVFRSGVGAGGARPAAAGAGPAGNPHARPGRGADELARYDPAIKLDLLKDLQSRPLPKLPRNPFEFEAREPAPASPAAVGPTTPAAPPSPPPIPLKAVGYSEKGGGVREAIVTDDQDIYVIHEGETFARRYHVLKISPAQVEIDDATTKQAIRLPIPQ